MTLESSIEKELMKYNQLKIDLLKSVKCIDFCQENEKELYQNIALEYSKELKHFKEFIKMQFDIALCSCCHLKKQDPESVGKGV